MAAPRPASSSEDLPCWLRIVAFEQGNTSTIELAGEWDLAQREATRHAVDQALQRRPERLVLDLSRLSFIDSSAIHGLIDTHIRCTEQRTRLVIISGPPAVQRLFELCGLTRILSFAAHDRPVDSRENPTTMEPGGFSSPPQRRRRSLARATGGAGPHPRSKVTNEPMRRKDAP